MAELAAFIAGVKEARDLGIDKLWIESDSAAMVVAILSCKIPWQVLQKWWSISHFLDSIQWRLTHCYREANALADALANYAARQQCDRKWTSTPDFITSKVGYDALGRPYYRFT
ncbi:uncharacterized protein LOC122655171 [Telopea speciosissima]|uniref:uncharacterized protein LOC122655171 n=1 Tax=Telopea speciosissima TaxID=54955 RepID=UPI001CC3A478|nr:uncharacterized protein LOC122655171 [Telopea speciosissima]